MLGAFYKCFLKEKEETIPKKDMIKTRIRLILGSIMKDLTTICVRYERRKYTSPL